MAHQVSEKSLRLSALRSELKKRKLTGFIVPRQDEFQGEYVAAYAERLRWLTGFAGSWGTAIILAKKAAIFVDGRYTIQITQQVDVKHFVPQHLIDEPPAKWLENNLQKGDRLGFDPMLLTAAQAKTFADVCKKIGAKLVPVQQNPIDTIWTEQPKRPTAQISVQPLQFAGKSAIEKLQDIAGSLNALKADATILTLPDSVSWAMNIRGLDVPFTPIVLAFALVKKTGKSILFIDRNKLPEDVRAHLKNVCIIKKPEDLDDEIASLGQKKSVVTLDRNTSPEKFVRLLTKSGATIVQSVDPCTMPKAQKNATEQEGARAAHRRDGVAVVRFLKWLEGEAPKGNLNEWAAAEKFREIRKQSELLLDLSFNTIAGAGPNAAIPHYSVNPDDCLPIKNNEIFLIDSGGQYQDGTTDITRTVIVGKPTDEMRDRFTRVLKGMINLSMIRFPDGTCGSQIDVLARAALWQAGLDFDHGTGHGVGSYLSVHEGPARINKSDRIPFKPGMILSNEPGFYKAGSFGIRIENLLLIKPAEKIAGGERAMMSFETLTFAPIDRNLIETKLMTRAELDWLDDYHADVLKIIGDQIDGDDLVWLKKACAKLS